MTETELEILLNDESKLINGDISWRENEDHSPAIEFISKIESGPGYPLTVRGYFNRASEKLYFSIIHGAEGRIYGLDFGRDHKDSVGDKHKHRWTEQRRANNTYIPEDISAAWNDPLLAWEQFCHEVRIRHEGKMNSPPEQQMDLF